GRVKRIELAPAGRAGASVIWHGSPDAPGPVSTQCHAVVTLRVSGAGARGSVSIGVRGDYLGVCDPPGAFRVGPFVGPPFHY
ncbi:MAG TPA: hypothetical protein VHX88_17280, partial [Solirubrobacteraceae bacterium]|nr:hypothetical protein [Solirubrobacteraceae bacterium]